MKIVLVSVLVLAAGIGLLVCAKFGPIPDERESLGPFELVTHTHRYLTGYNEGQIRSATTETYSLRYAGKPFTFVGRAGMNGETISEYTRANALITFPTAEPAVIVNVGDPNNTSFFYLVRERGGTAVADYLGEGDSGVSAEWLDPAPEHTPPVTNIALHRGRMDGGRFLLLGQSTVLDVSSLKSYAVRAAYGAWVNPFKPPIALSPDRTSFVRWGSGSDDAPLLVVFDFVADTSYTLPVDRKRMRFNGWEEIDRAWLDYHFEWQPVAGGHERLAIREGVGPLAYQGDLRVDSYDSAYVEYNLVRVRPEMQAEVLRFLEREFQARNEGPDLSGSTVTVRIEEETVHVLLSDDQVGVFQDRGGDPKIIREIGRRFDAALATGEYDTLFLP